MSRTRFLLGLALVAPWPSRHEPKWGLGLRSMLVPARGLARRIAPLKTNLQLILSQAGGP